MFGARLGAYGSIVAAVTDFFEPAAALRSSAAKVGGLGALDKNKPFEAVGAGKRFFPFGSENVFGGEDGDDAGAAERHFDDGIVADALQLMVCEISSVASETEQTHRI